MSSYLEIYHREVPLPEFKRFLALSQDRILVSESTTLTLFASSGLPISTCQIPSQPILLLPSGKDSVLVKTKSQILEVNLITKKVEIKKQIESNSNSFRLIGEWKGGIGYLQNDKLFHNGRLIDNDVGREYEVELISGHKIVKYNQLALSQDAPVTIYSLSDPPADSEQREEVLEIVNYNDSEGFSDHLIVKIAEINGKLITFSNKKNQGYITQHDTNNLDQFTIPDNIIDLLKLQQSTGVAVLFTNSKGGQGQGKVLTNESPKECIKIVNIITHSILNIFQVPMLMLYSSHPGSDNILFLASSRPTHQSIQMFQLVKKNRVYMHLAISMKLDTVFGQLIVKQTIKALT